LQSYLGNKTAFSTIKFVKVNLQKKFGQLARFAIESTLHKLKHCTWNTFIIAFWS